MEINNNNNNKSINHSQNTQPQRKQTQQIEIQGVKYTISFQSSGSKEEVGELSQEQLKQLTEHCTKLFEGTDFRKHQQLALTETNIKPLGKEEIELNSQQSSNLSKIFSTLAPTDSPLKESTPPPGQLLLQREWQSTIKSTTEKSPQIKIGVNRGKVYDEKTLTQAKETISYNNVMISGARNRQKNNINELPKSVLLAMQETLSEVKGSV